MDLQPIIDAVQGAETVKLRDGREAIVAPETAKIVVMDRKADTKPVDTRIIAFRDFHDGDSLAAYINRFREAGKGIFLADLKRQNLLVVLDYHEGLDVGACEHKAKWEMQLSEEFEAWSKMEGVHPQADFVRFLDENAQDIIAPDPATILDLCRDFEAIRDVEFSSSIRLDSGDRKLNYVTDTKTKAGIDIPTQFHLNVPIFYGEESTRLKCMFRHRIRDGELFLGFEFYRMQPVIDAAFRGAAVRVAEESGMQALFGV